MLLILFLFFVLVVSCGDNLAVRRPLRKHVRLLHVVPYMPYPIVSYRMLLTLDIGPINYNYLLGHARSHSTPVRFPDRYGVFIATPDTCDVI